MKKIKIYKLRQHKCLTIFLGCLLFVSILTFVITLGALNNSSINTDGTNVSGVVNNVVYVNNIESDWYYYKGLNYTNSDNGYLPTFANKNIYNEKTLVQVQITYSSIDITNSSLKGYVSNTELQDTYVYYNLYHVNDNGTASTADDFIEIELIDNPFSYRPNDMGFNGWTTNYASVNIRNEREYYTRYAKVPITYNTNGTNKMSITFHAAWTEAKIGYTSDGWSNSFNNIDPAGINKLETVKEIWEGADISNYYTQTTISRRQYCYNCYEDDGTYHDSYYCSNRNGCTMYYKATEYNADTTYYELVESYWYNYMQAVTVDPPVLVDTIPLDRFTATLNMAGYYLPITINYYDSISGYYDSAGNYINSGTCYTSGGCNYYDLIEYNDSELFDQTKTYYYMTTRDTNIIVLNSNVSTTWDSNNDKPFTLTGLYNGTKYTNYLNVSSTYVKCYADTGIEQLQIYSGTSNNNSNPTTSTTSSVVFYGNAQNAKIGRGITQNGTRVNFTSIIGGTNGSFGSSSSLAKYHLIVESGSYNATGLVNGPVSSGTVYTEMQAIYGNDYDKVTNNNNNLEIYYCACGSWGGTIYSSSTQTGIAISLTVKSGSFGTGKYDYTTGIYVGGRSYGTHYAAREAKIEGGYIYNLIGGPLTGTNRTIINDTYMYVTGGSIDMVSGGAGTSATYGNRIIQVTGGTINYSVFGGSNGYQGSSSDGKINGSSYLYIGGNAIIGDDTYVNNNSSLWNAEAGSVFGIGNGRSGSSYTLLGSCDNSNLVIADNAIIKRNVYGGGNFGATGSASSSSTTETNILVIGGTINGSLYGGGNNNGSGTSSKVATINIEMPRGTVGNIYGGSNELGTIYGTSNVKINGGTVGNVYGGGQGGYYSSSSTGTFVARDVNVQIGDSSYTTAPTITGSVYGGSAFGTVNGTSNTTSLSSYNTSVIVNKGTIGNVFGGGQGDVTYTPYVEGNVSVTVNNGTITNVFGGNDQKGTPNGTVTVTINNGNIENTYGGGNKTGVTTTNVYLKGGTSTDIFGGSNLQGNVNTSYITVTGGSSSNIYGGNNAGGKTNSSVININGGVIGNTYGGGKLADTGITNITLNNGTVTNTYGGGESASIDTSTTINLAGTNAGTIFGGSNTTGNVPTSYITTISGSATNIYGGNNAGGKTNSSVININGAVIGNVYGGGKLADTGIANITLNNGTVTNTYGGGESASIDTSTTIILNNTIATTIYGGSNTSGTVPVSYINDNSSTCENIYAANNAGGTTTNSNIELNGSIIGNVYGGGNKAFTTTSNINLNNGTITNIYGGGNQAGVNDTIIKLTNGTVTNTFGGSNSSGVVENSSITTPSLNTTDTINISNIYGGNNQGGSTTTANIRLTKGTFNNVYGGGNNATTGTTTTYLKDITVTGELYGGGNQAGVINDTKLDILSSNCGTIFGGGNAGTVGGSTELYISNSNITDSIYAGGNGTTAVVNGNTTLNIDGTTNVTNSIFGGGNAAATGTQETNNSKGTVNIAGAVVGKNVYGGANTSVLYGEAKVNIGLNAINDTTNTLIKGPITINGTIFGGGEANASGSDVYDYSFISVTTGIIINIDGNAYSILDINGSIFGSGNASSTTGYSFINIKNYGDFSEYRKNVSIQRTNILTIDNSNIELAGATDRTNEYSTTIFALSRIDELKLKNNSSLFLQTGANLLKKFSSLVDINGVETKAVVTINTDGTTTRNVNNRVYMYEGKNLNIATSENTSSFGEVNGMTFFGMYKHDRNDNAITALYDKKYNNGDTPASGDLYYFQSGSYVLGLHKTNHNIEVDGFYSNFDDVDENDVSSGKLKTKYIMPTPESSSFYMWVIGEKVASYDIELTASKYSTLGAYELPLVNNTSPNTTFTIVGFNSSDLDSNFELVDEKDIPRVALDGKANTRMGLAMKTSNTGWITVGSTTFKTSDTEPIKGTVDYKSENSSNVPSLLFYFYHSKNITETKHLGAVTISLLVITPIDDLI